MGENKTLTFTEIHDSMFESLASEESMSDELLVSTNTAEAESTPYLL